MWLSISRPFASTARVLSILGQVRYEGLPRRRLHDDLRLRIALDLLQKRERRFEIGRGADLLAEIRALISIQPTAP